MVWHVAELPSITVPGMDKVIIARCSFAEMAEAKSFPCLLEEYAQESRLSGLPAPAMCRQVYDALEQSGALHVFCAYQGDTLVGFLLLLVSLNPHYSVRLAVIESFFVGNAHRKTGAGMKLRFEAEHHAKQLGAVGLLISAPVESRLEKVLEADKAYRASNRIFFRRLA